MNYTPTAQEQVLNLFPRAAHEIIKGVHCIRLKPNQEPIAYSHISMDRAWILALRAITNQNIKP